MSKSLSIFALASLLHGAWAQSDENTTAPTPGPNDCDGFLPGDIYFTYVKSLEPDEVVLFPYEDIPGGLKLYLTDNAWTGSGFQTDEGTLEVSKHTPQSVSS